MDSRTICRGWKKRAGFSFPREATTSIGIPGAKGSIIPHPKKDLPIGTVRLDRPSDRHQDLGDGILPVFTAVIEQLMTVPMVSFFQTFRVHLGWRDHPASGAWRFRGARVLL